MEYKHLKAKAGKVTDIPIAIWPFFIRNMQVLITMTFNGISLETAVGRFFPTHLFLPN